MERRGLARVFGALNSEIRLRILELVSAHREMCVCELVDQLRLSQANVSRHVAILRDAALLQDRKVGTWVLLRVDESVLDQASGELADTIRRNHRASRHQNAEKRLEARCASLSTP